MKIFIALLACFSTFTTRMNAFEIIEDSQCNNLSVNEVVTTQNGVYLLVNAHWIEADAMQASNDGIFVLENGEWLSLSEALKSGNYYVWQCKKCYAWNSEGTNKCSNCGKPR
jgi:hypothetical protein